MTQDAVEELFQGKTTLVSNTWCSLLPLSSHWNVAFIVSQDVVHVGVEQEGAKDIPESVVYLTTAINVGNDCDRGVIGYIVNVYNLVFKVFTNLCLT